MTRLAGYKVSYIVVALLNDARSKQQKEPGAQSLLQNPQRPEENTGYIRLEQTALAWN